MRRHVFARPVVLLVAICAFAAVDAIVKGHHGGTRNAVGNISAPWALLPFLSAASVMPRRPSIGAVVGAISTVAALACYSLVRMAVSAQSGPHGDAGSALAAAAGNRWFLLGAIGGGALGAMGAWLAARQRWAVVVAVVAGLLALEPAARVLWAIAQGDPARTLVPSPVVWTLEVFCGCAAAIAFSLRRARHS